MLSIFTEIRGKGLAVEYFILVICFIMTETDASSRELHASW